jgi:flagellar biosynthetic protein FlhB
MADDFGEKTEAPTPRRRTEAREQGNIPRSQDLTSALLLLAAMVLLSSCGPGLVTALRSLVAQMLGSASLADTSVEHTTHDTLRGFLNVSESLAPFLAGIALAAILANVGQVGFQLSTQRITPNLGALNPLGGLGRIFSGGKGGVRLLLDALKILLLGAVGYSAVHGRIVQIITVQQLSFVQIFMLGSQVVYSIGLRIGITLLILAIIDYAYQRYRIEQELKMSKQEVKEEMRRMDGDPKIKMRRRQIAMQAAQQKLKKDVPTADVVVTNPTEYAIALKYDPKVMSAPKVIAKGRDLMAQRIRQLAIENGIPILERKPLARALYKLVDVGHEVPEEFYAAIAEILAYVYDLGGKIKLRKAEFSGV